jgi:hypothetical protein
MLDVLAKMADIDFGHDTLPSLLRRYKVIV